MDFHFTASVTESIHMLGHEIWLLFFKNRGFGWDIHCQKCGVPSACLVGSSSSRYSLSAWVGWEVDSCLGWTVECFEVTMADVGLMLNKTQASGPCLSRPLPEPWEDSSNIAQGYMIFIRLETWKHYSSNKLYIYDLGFKESSPSLGK